MNYPVYIAHTYSLFALCTEFHAARMQSKFCPKFPHHTQGWASPVYDITKSTISMSTTKTYVQVIMSLCLLPATVKKNFS